MKKSIAFFGNRSKVLTALLVTLGFSACKDSDPEERACLYGTPSVDFHVVGQVTDEGGNPLAGIKAKVGIFDEYGDQPLDSAYTDAQGRFRTPNEVRHISLDDSSLKVVFEDANRPGAYKSDTADVRTAQRTQVGKGDGSWYQGRYEVRVDRQMRASR